MKNHIPLYKEIEQYIMAQIRSNNWTTNTKIPSENELAAQFHVSRITVKNALTNLVESGVIFRQQGKGSFVSPNHHIALDSLYQKQNNGQQRVIGFLMPRLDNRFTANVLSGIEDELSNANYHLIFSKTNDSQTHEILKIKKMLEYGVDGLIIYPVEGEHYNNEILSLTLSKFPIVLVDRFLKGIDTSSVSSDNYNASIEAVDHLYELGHRHIALFSSKAEGTSSIEDRISGYEQGLENNKILINRSLQVSNMPFGMTDEQIYSIVSNFLDGNPEVTAIIACTMGVDIIRAVLKTGRHIPKNLSIIIFDDIPAANYSFLAPTVIAQQEVEIGREAAKHIIEQIQHIEQGEQICRRIQLPTTIIARDTTDIAPQSNTLPIS
ncbi:GntR family transcriptional regulator [Paenibacillus sp. FA6]|uniref:GntR family transcriptional regulator n=1 Tax=Paenibacillus sp. FA6 TaxID=3413029 RepID=UPI003F65578D